MSIEGYRLSIDKPEIHEEMGKRKTNENFESKKTVETSILEKLVAEAIVKVKADYQQEINSLRNELNVVRNNQELVTEQCKQNIDSLKQDVSILIEKLIIFLAV